MIKQYLVIGLGNFGWNLAIQLHKIGHEVIVMDKNHQLVQEIKDEVEQAIVGDSTNIKTLRSLGVETIDTVIIGMGSNLSASILTALNLLDLGVKHVMAKATNDAHARILEKIGIEKVFSPEKDYAISTAERLNNPNMIDYLPFVEEYSIVQVSPPEKFIGSSLKELNLTNKYGIQIIAIKDQTSDKLKLIPTGEYILKKKDELIVLGENTSLNEFSES